MGPFLMKINNLYTKSRKIMPRKKLNETRTSILNKKIKNISDPEQIMLNILEVFKEIDWVPSVGKYYTFVYNAKTLVNENNGTKDLDRIYYDQHPLVAVFRIYSWGFEGLNYHWRKIRRYTWEEIAGPLHVVYESELNYMRKLNYTKLVRYKKR